MDIELLDDFTITCTISEKELKSREIDLVNLTYNSDKIQVLCNDIISEANSRFNFNIDSSPISVDVIPNDTTLTLILGRIKYSSSNKTTNVIDDLKNESSSIHTNNIDSKEKILSNIDTKRAYIFDSYDNLFKLASLNIKWGKLFNSLYKIEENYILYVDDTCCDKETFLYYASIISEYATKIETSSVSLSFYNETYSVLENKNALQKIQKYLTKKR